jgi:hypothetical protein
MHSPLDYFVFEGHVCHLRRSLYGLKQAPHAWFECFTSVVIVAGFFPSQHGPALFVHTSSVVIPLFFSMWMICSSWG